MAAFIRTEGRDVPPVSAPRHESKPGSSKRIREADDDVEAEAEGAAADIRGEGKPKTKKNKKRKKAVSKTSLAI